MGAFLISSLLFGIVNKDFLKYELKNPFHNSKILVAGGSGFKGSY